MSLVLLEMKLSIPDLLKDWEKCKSWNISRYAYGSENSTLIGDETWQIKFPAGSFNPPSKSENRPKGGVVFYATPQIFPRNEITLQYEIMFPADFDWVKGGKNPGGLCIGDPGSSGGRHQATGSTFRVMWRRNGQSEAYCYVPTDQDPAYDKLPGLVKDPDYGDSIFRGCANFITGKFQNVRLHAKMNTFTNGKGNKDGLLELQVGNNPVSSYNKIVWLDTKSDNSQITSSIWQTFFGGKDVSWSPSKDQTIQIRNIRMS